MTKLDEILDARDNLRGKETDGGYMGNKPMLTKSEAKQQIKELFLELIPEYTHNDSTAHSKMTDEKIRTGFNYAVKKFRTKVEEL